MATSSFKLDTASLPKLQSLGNNYTEWCAAWTIAFRYTELWPFVRDCKGVHIAKAELLLEYEAREREVGKRLSIYMRSVLAPIGPSAARNSRDAITAKP